MSDSARDYALPIDGQVHTIPCGPGPLLTAELDDECDNDDLQPDERTDPCQTAYLWIHQLGALNPNHQRHFTTRLGRQDWPDFARHITSLRAHNDRGMPTTVHVLEVLL